MPILVRCQYESARGERERSSAEQPEWPAGRIGANPRLRAWQVSPTCATGTVPCDAAGDGRRPLARLRANPRRGHDSAKATSGTEQPEETGYVYFGKGASTYAGPLHGAGKSKLIGAAMTREIRSRILDAACERAGLRGELDAPNVRPPQSTTRSDLRDRAGRPSRQP